MLNKLLGKIKSLFKSGLRLRRVVRRLYYRVYVYCGGGWCDYHRREIKSISWCGVCSVCNWNWKCSYFIRFR